MDLERAHVEHHVGERPGWKEETLELLNEAGVGEGKDAWLQQVAEVYLNVFQQLIHIQKTIQLPPRWPAFVPVRMEVWSTLTTLGASKESQH